MWKILISASLLAMVEPRSSILDIMPVAFPVQGIVSSDYGWRVSPVTDKRGFHVGLDIAANLGDPIYAPADGIVLRTGEKKLLGKFIILEHAGGVTTKYGHLNEILVDEGQEIQRGEQIASVGITGRTTGAHLHYEILIEGNNIDPKLFILLLE